MLRRDTNVGLTTKSDINIPLVKTNTSYAFSDNKRSSEQFSFFTSPPLPAK